MSVHALDRLMRSRLRIYGITIGSKVAAVYFGSLALARPVLALTSAIARPVTFVDLPPIPVDAFNMCPVQIHPIFRIVPFALPTLFGASA